MPVCRLVIRNNEEHDRHANALDSRYFKILHGYFRCRTTPFEIARGAYDIALGALLEVGRGVPNTRNKCVLLAHGPLAGRGGVRYQSGVPYQRVLRYVMFTSVISHPVPCQQGGDAKQKAEVRAAHTQCTFGEAAISKGLPYQRVLRYATFTSITGRIEAYAHLRYHLAQFGILPRFHSGRSSFAMCEAKRPRSALVCVCVFSGS